MLLHRSFTFAAIAQQFSTIAQTAQAEPNSRSLSVDTYPASTTAPYASRLPMPYAVSDEVLRRSGR